MLALKLKLKMFLYCYISYSLVLNLEFQLTAGMILQMLGFSIVLKEAQVSYLH